MQEITVGPLTKPAHQKFIAWLNGLLNSYETGFWDWSIKNMIKYAFIDTHYTSIQEQYTGDGYTPLGFIMFGALNTSSPQILVFSESGVPILHCDNINSMFLFNSKGRLVEFFEGASLPLLDAAGSSQYELIIRKIERYGINMPFLIMRRLADNLEETYGLIDTYFTDRHSGTYMVELKPLEDLPKYVVRNVSGLDQFMEIPVLMDLNLRYLIPAGRAALVPITVASEYFLRNSQNDGIVTYYIADMDNLPNEQFIPPINW